MLDIHSAMGQHLVFAGIFASFPKYSAPINATLGEFFVFSGLIYGVLNLE